MVQATVAIGRSIADVAVELGCDWHTVMDAVTVWGTRLIDDPHRFGVVDAVGLDETLCVQVGRYRTQVCRPRSSTCVAVSCST